MHLPNAAEAVVSRAKIVDCLLSVAHPRGRGMARFFASADQVRPANPGEIASARVLAA